MATTSPPPRAAGPPPQPAPARRGPPVVWLAVGAVVVVAAIIAIVASSRTGNDKTKTSIVTGSAGSKQTVTLHQTQPVTVTGNALPIFDDGTDGAVGRVAPELRGKSFDGTPVAVTHDGRAKLVLFVAHWCPHCQREVPLLVSYLKSHPLPKSIDLVAVATSTSSNDPNYPPSAWLERSHWPARVLADSSDFRAANAYGLSAFPFFVALDAQGKVVARTSGEISTDQFAAVVRQAVKS